MLARTAGRPLRAGMASITCNNGGREMELRMSDKLSVTDVLSTAERVQLIFSFSCSFSSNVLCNFPTPVFDANNMSVSTFRLSNLAVSYVCE